MSYVSPFGKKPGLERRLNTWANQLNLDKKFPWVGTGLIDDLKLAASLLGAPAFEEMFPARDYTAIAAPIAKPEPELEDWEKEWTPDEPEVFDL